MGDGRAEKGQQPVAHQPGNGAFVAVDGAHHALERAVDDVAPLFGVELFGQGGGAFDVAEEHGDDAAFAGHCAGAAGGFELVHQLAGDELLERLPFIVQRFSTFFCPCRNGVVARAKALHYKRLLFIVQRFSALFSYKLPRPRLGAKGAAAGVAEVGPGRGRRTTGGAGGQQQVAAVAAERGPLPIGRVATGTVHVPSGLRPWPNIVAQYSTLAGRCAL